MRVLFALTGLAVALSAADRAAAAPSEHPMSFAWFALKGSVAVAAGHPTYRISPATSTGRLAIRDEDRRPAVLWRLFPIDQRAVETTVSGHFVVCPLEPPNPGGLRLVRIKSAHNLRRKIDNWLEQADH